MKKIVTRIMAVMISMSVAIPSVAVSAAQMPSAADQSEEGEVTEVLRCDDVYTVHGVKPVLPDKVKVKIGEAESERDVVWDLEGKKFSGDSGTVTVEGSVSGSEKKASVNVNMAVENAVYVIDCNSPNSKLFQDAAKYAGLKNQTGDQKYGNGNAWGYLEDYKSNAPNNPDIYQSGWYADKNKGDQEQVIKYTLPLDAGNYKVTFGVSEWWRDYNSHRYMKAFAVYQNGTEQELGRVNTYNGGNWWNTASFSGISCENDGEVTFELRKDDDGEPVLSFLKVQKELDLTSLKDALQKYAQIDKTKFVGKDQELANLYQTALDGHKLLYLSSATQESVDHAASALEAALEALGSVEVDLSKEALEANHQVLYTVNCGTPDPNVIPNTDSGCLGLLQTSVDQKLGRDAMTGYRWGCDPDTEYSIVAKSAQNATDIGKSFIYMSTAATFDAKQSALGYSFELPEIEAEGFEPNKFEVTVAFEHHWDDKKVMNILLEGRTVATDVSAGNGDWVRKTFIAEVTDGELNVQVKAPRRKNASGDPILNFIEVHAVKRTDPEIITYDYITGNAGESLYDTEGKQIQAHGGQVQKIGDTWYWIGEDKTYDYRPCGGIHMYSSKDLCNWQDEGIVLRTMESEDEFEEDNYFKSLYGDLTKEQKTEVFIDLDRNNCVMERPKMLYNKKTKKYVIWFHADGRTPENSSDYGKAKAGVAVSDNPSGPFKLLGSYKLNYHKGEDGGEDKDYDYGYDGWGGRGSVRDMNLFQEDDGTAYVVYSSDGNNTTYISRLNEDYTGLAADRDEAVEGTDFIRAFPWSREAPAMFKYKEKYFIINSGCSGWTPNAAECWYADSPLGSWEKMSLNGGNPCVDSGSDTTYQTQSTCVIPVDPDNGFYIYMGDRWNAGNLSESRYVWLPIEFNENDEPAIRAESDWNPWEKQIEKAKGLFESVLNEAKALKRTDYTKASWSVLQAALDAAREVQENDKATAEEITAARKEIQAGIAGLEEAPKASEEDWGKLEAAIQEAEIKQESDYTDKSWKPFAQALADAKELCASRDASKEAVEEAADLLASAQGGLREANRAALEAAAQEARGKEESVYTKASFSSLKKALEAAETALADINTEATEIKKALDRLEIALGKLIKKNLPQEGPVTQFMDCIEPMYITSELSEACWGAPDVGAREQDNGLEDKEMQNYCYWDGGIIKDEETGKYYMFASRWNQAGGHWGENGISGWQGSQAIYATSDSLYGPYTDQGPIWPDWCEGAGHNVFPFQLSTSDPLYEEGFRYAISISDTGMHGDTANGTIHIAKSIDGPWELIDNGNSGKLKASGGDGFSLSNISIMVRPDGKYEATNRNGDIAIADSVAGTWEVKVNGLWWKIGNMNPEQVEDPVIWYSDGLYHIVVNKWDARMAYYMTSEDGVSNWTRRPGTAYTPIADFLRYEDGTVNRWAKIERPNIYVEDGKIAAMTFAVIDVQKESDHGNDQHGSKVIVVPFSSKKLKELDAQPNLMEHREGMLPKADTTAQSYRDEDGKNYGAEEFLQIQKSPDYLEKRMGRFGEGKKKPYDEYDNKLAYIKYDISKYANVKAEDIESACLSLVYQERVAGDAESTRIEAVLCDGVWEEGDGNESVNNNAAATNDLTWNRRPALNYSEDDVEGTIAQSDLIYTADLKRVVNIDVTNLVKKFVRENPQKTEICFALNATSTGSRFRLNSKESGDSLAPMLKIGANGMTVVDKALLNQAIEEAKILDESEYTVESWVTFQKKLSEAEKVSQSTEASQDEVDRALGALNDAKDALKKKEIPVIPNPVDKSALNAAIKEAEMLNESEYTAESWSIFKDKLIAAREAAQNTEISQDEVNQALRELNDAKEALNKKDTTVTPVDPGKPDKPGADTSVKVTKIMLSSPVKKLAKGMSIQIQANVSPANASDKALAWESSNGKAATVNAQGIVTGTGNGTATITASAKDGSSVKGAVTIAVVNGAVKKISLKSNTKGIAAGKKITLETKISASGKDANKTLSWSTSNSKYATVNSKGVVSAKKAGAGKTVTITARSTDGSQKSASVKIKIVKHAVKKINLKCNKKTVTAGKKVTIKADVKTTGKSANKVLKWETSNKRYATVNSKGVVTTKKAGKRKTVTITAVSTDGTNKKARVKIKIK